MIDVRTSTAGRWGGPRPTRSRSGMSSTGKERAQPSAGQLRRDDGQGGGFCVRIFTIPELELIGRPTGNVTRVSDRPCGRATRPMDARSHISCCGYRRLPVRAVRFRERNPHVHVVIQASCHQAVPAASSASLACRCRPCSMRGSKQFLHTSTNIPRMRPCRSTPNFTPPDSTRSSLLVAAGSCRRSGSFTGRYEAPRRFEAISRSLSPPLPEWLGARGER